MKLSQSFRLDGRLMRRKVYIECQKEGRTRSLSVELLLRWDTLA